MNHRASFTVQGFVANELTVRAAGSQRVVEVVVPYTRQRLGEDGWRDLGPTLWVKATFWDDHVDVVLQSVQKGTLVVLSGDPALEVYKRADGDPAGRIVLHSPVLSVVVRRPPRFTGDAAPGAAPSWAPPAADVAPGGDPDPGYPAAGSYSDDTPF